MKKKPAFSWSPVLLISCLFFAAAAIEPVAAQKQHRRVQHKAAAKKPAEHPIDRQAIARQVMLDRAGYSPGEIDGTKNTATERALDAFTKHGGDAAALPQDALTRYRITEQDAAGPFTASIPSELPEMAKLDALNYRSVQEALGERFHVNPRLLRRLNPDAMFTAGDEIQVPNVAQNVSPIGPPRGSQANQVDQSNPAVTTVTVRKSTSDLTVTDNTGRVLMYAPVTTGSEHDPLPIGDWKVTGVQRNPTFNYDPQLFWDANAKDPKATIPPGPNNPVGVVWIDISRPHYGLHGTPEPSAIGKTTSHGCVRLTNWDAEKLAGLVRPGTKVVFSE